MLQLGKMYRDAGAGYKQDCLMIDFAGGNAIVVTYERLCRCRRHGRGDAV